MASMQPGSSGPAGPTGRGRWRVGWRHLSRGYRALSIGSTVTGLVLSGLATWDLLADTRTGAATVAPNRRAGDVVATTTATDTSTTTSTSPVSTSAPPATAGPAVTRCANDTWNFSFEHPATWHVQGSPTDGACLFLHPEPFEVPEASEITVAVTVIPIAVSFEEVLALYDDTSVALVRERDDSAIDGRRAVRVLYEGGELGFVPGSLFYDVAIEGPGYSLVLSAIEAHAPDFDQARAVVDTAVASLELS